VNVRPRGQVGERVPAAVGVRWGGGGSAGPARERGDRSRGPTSDGSVVTHEVPGCGTGGLEQLFAALPQAADLHEQLLDLDLLVGRAVDVVGAADLGGMAEDLHGVA
jgi:hypothetical protein